MPTTFSVNSYNRKEMLLKNNSDFLSHLGWSFIVGVIGAIGLIASSALFLTEANIQRKKLRQLKDSQARFELERSTKA